MKILDNLGIPNCGPQYLELTEEQHWLNEIDTIRDMIIMCLDSFEGKEKSIKFINYGRTQLVYVINIDDKLYTMLINQPATKLGTGKKEYENLLKLNELDSNIVIKPIKYVENGKSEAYITPYHYQSRCVGATPYNWGTWVPEPSYHFRDFTDDDRKIINSCMVALLIKLYNEETQKGLAKVRLDGGDFMLDKGYEEDVSIDNIMNNIKLIAARELINISLDDYINLIREELSGRNKDNILIGRDLRINMNNDEIEEGISLGLSLRNKKIR